MQTTNNTMKLPQSLPILTTFSARVAGCAMNELLRSPTALARALGDTQAVVGHDGVLCLFDPQLLSSACTGAAPDAGPAPAADEAPLTPPAKLALSAPLGVLLETVQALPHYLPDYAKIYAAFSGPGLLRTQLREALALGGRSTDRPAGGDPVTDYVRDVLRSVVRAFLEHKADGIALIEMGEAAPELAACYKVVQKLADFYGAGYVVFRLPSGERQDVDFKAHCVFDLPAPGDGIGPVYGRRGAAGADRDLPRTSAGDVPDDTPVEELKQMFAYAGS